jgi:diaminopimelate decarboxylase
VEASGVSAARTFGVSGGELHVEGVPISAIAERFGTPLFVYSAEVLDRSWTRVRGTFPPQFSICYSVKANPNPAILRHFLGKGCGLEVASSGEVARALEAGCPAEDIVFAGPGKTDRELVEAMAHGVGEIHLESLREGHRLAAFARRLGKPAPVALRVNPRPDAQGGAMRMGGRPSPFGVDEEMLEAVLEELDADPFLDVRGLHLFTGTQILDHVVLARQYRIGIDLARRTGACLGRPLRSLDFGGGLGIPYFAGETELDMTRLAAELSGMAEELRGDRILGSTRLFIEPGRYLAGPAGIYVSRIVDVKVSRGKTFLVVDGGMNHHLAASGNLGQVIRRNFPVAILNKLEKDNTDTVDLVGPLCTPLDTLARDLPVPSPEVNDIVGIFQSGAYGLTASPTAFLSHPSAAEVLVQDGQARLVRKRGAISDPENG